MANDSGERRAAPIGSKRRQLLQAAGSGAVVALAGCSQSGPSSDDGGSNGTGDGDGNDSGNDSDGGADGGSGEPMDDTFSGAVWTNPDDAQYNPYNPRNFPGVGIDILFDQLARYSPVERSFVPSLATEWSWADDTTFDLTLASDRTWHDGSDLTAEDVALRLRLDKHMLPSAGAWQYLDGVSVAGPQKLQFSLAEKTNRRVFETLVLPTMVYTPPAHFSDHLQAFREASGEEEKKAVKSELLEYTIREPIGNGPFAYEGREGKVRLLFSKYGEYPTADSINWSKYELNYLPTNNKNWAAMNSGTTDGTTFGSTKKVVEGFPEYVVRSDLPTLRGIGFQFQHDHEVWGRRRVRRAFGHIVNRSDLYENTPGFKSPIEVITGHDFGPKVDEWFGDLLGDFDAYEQDHERAAALLREAGFSKESGSWVGEGGDPLEAPISASSCCNEYVAQAQTAVSQLQSFGVEARMKTVDPTTAVSLFEKGDFAIWTGGIGAGGKAHPYFNYAQYFTDQITRKAQSMPKRFEVPMPVGDAEGDLQTVDVVSKVEELGRVSGEAATELVHELGWVYNQALPNYPISQFTNSGWMTTDHWEFPDVSEPIMSVYAPAYFLMKKGKLRAKTK
jgi:peptide/nickel transport system substrate-binding protein